MRLSRTWTLAALFAGAGLLAGGCRSETVEGPDTVPLRGKIELTGGGSVKNLADYSVVVEFQSVEKPELKAFGAILEDGTFTMTTQVGDKGKPGVIPGMHRVRLNADESGARYVAQKFLRYETSGLTVKAPAEGEVVLKVSK